MKKLHKINVDVPFYLVKHRSAVLYFVIIVKLTCWSRCVNKIAQINRGSYMSAHVLLNLLNELGKRDKMRGLPSILSLFRNEFNKFNNKRARMLDFIYHMTLRLL